MLHLLHKSLVLYLFQFQLLFTININEFPIKFKLIKTEENFLNTFKEKKKSNSKNERK